jgi:predicted nuclease with TOPRIM domain
VHFCCANLFISRKNVFNLEYLKIIKSQKSELLKEIERQKMEKEKYQQKIKEMEKQLSQLSTAPALSSTLQVKKNLKNLILRNETVSFLCVKTVLFNQR